MPKEKFIIIDGNALLHRSFHALPPLTNKKGEMVNAIYGFTMILLKALREIKPQYIAVTFDRKEKTFRHDMYAHYKATRVKAEGIEEMYKQIPKLKELLDAFHIPIYEKAGYEADDLIGTIANKLYIGNNIQGNTQIETIIVTGDLDTLQLINDSTKVYTLKKGLSEMIVYGEEQVKERFDGLTPEQMIDYKALRGDPSDNIPGVKGIGEKGAINLLKNFGTLENLYEKLDAGDAKLSVKLEKLLLDHKKEAFESKTMARIENNSPIDFKFKACEWKTYDQKKVFDLFQEFEFQSLLNKLPTNIDVPEENNTKSQCSLLGDIADNKPSADYTYKLIHPVNVVDLEENFKNFLEELKKQTQIVIDTETTSIDSMSAELLGISFCWKKGEAYYVPISNPSASLRTSFQFPIFNELKNILENPEIKKCGHNIKYDEEVIYNAGIKLQGINFDTMIAAYLLNPGSRAFSLDNLAFTELGHLMIPIEDLIGKGKNQINMKDAQVEKVSVYSCEDADYTFRLMEKLKPRLAQYKSDKIFSEIEIPLIPVLAKMEREGIKINTEFLKHLDKDLKKEKNKIEKKIWDLAGNEFNISSPVQLKEILFEKLALPIKNIKKGKTGLSTAAAELEKMRGLHPIIDLISEYRELAKLISTYVEALPKLVNKKTGRVHTSFNQTITATGRLSSSDPNLQNIPIRTELGKSIRTAFIAEKGYKLLSADYSQIELRVIASMAKDKKMIGAFKAGDDIHTTTASKIFKIQPEEVTKDMRRKAKTINFGIMYGMGPRGLADAADATYEEAQNFIDEYFLLYKDVKKYLDETLETTGKKGYVETFFGRRRYLPEIASSAPMIRASAERMAINHPIQGTSADLIKMAMIKLDKKLEDGIKMILQIHDELLFEIREDLIDKASKIIREEMENAARFETPIKVDISIGDNWGEL